MIIREAAYVISNPSVEKCPAPDLPEYAFIGRSNVGKSSLINMVTDRKQLAKTSASPGKTQLINHFLINKEWYLVDLPGYGYAKVSWADRIKWQKMIRDYMMKRPNLMHRCMHHVHAHDTGICRNTGASCVWCIHRCSGDWS